MKRGTKQPTKLQAMQALDVCADLLSDASPNRSNDPWSWWARQRAVKQMTPKQAQQFAMSALTVLEYTWGKKTLG